MLLLDWKAQAGVMAPCGQPGQVARALFRLFWFIPGPSLLHDRTIRRIGNAGANQRRPYLFFIHRLIGGAARCGLFQFTLSAHRIERLEGNRAHLADHFAQMRAAMDAANPFIHRAHKTRPNL